MKKITNLGLGVTVIEKNNKKLLHPYKKVQAVQK